MEKKNNAGITSSASYGDRTETALTDNLFLILLKLYTENGEEGPSITAFNEGSKTEENATFVPCEEEGNK